ncbi:MAG: MBL fold metallo-hydrolase RNA specificity domain-containing protein [Phycisphaerales bacterium]
MNASIRLSFFGAAGEVTGSCYLVETARARVLIDFGLHQGGRETELRNHQHPPIDARRLDAVVLTHAHIDHCGRLPLLVTQGFRGEIHCTAATADLAAILLRDSAQLQEADAAREAVRANRRGETALPALYSRDECERVMPMFAPLGYLEKREIAPGVTIRLVDAGHILGSASVEMRVETPGRSALTLFFSGDIGQTGTPLLRDFVPPGRVPGAPTPPIEPDVVIMESTYGDRGHRPQSESAAEFESIIEAAQSSRGKILVPSFAVGRTQTLVYHLGNMVRARRLNGGGGGGGSNAGGQNFGGSPVPVFVDSPMAVDATELYARHRALFDDETWAMIDRGDSPLKFPGLRYLRTGDESRSLNDLEGSAVIVAASGMCTGGRIMHHLKHHLWKVTTHVVIAGYQSQGSVGRQLVDRAHRVMIMGEPVVVRAKVHTLGGFSAHAGQPELMRWASGLKGTSARVFLTHGERMPRQALAARLKSELGLAARMPEYHEVVDL